MAAEASVDDELLFDIRLGELEEQDAGGQVVDVSESERDQALVELVRDDLHIVSLSRAGPGERRGGG